MTTTQLDRNQQLRHLLTLEGIPRNEILDLLDRAAAISAGEIPHCGDFALANIFCEPSTRTRATFELAAKRLGGHVINLDLGHASTSKGETLADTVATLHAAGCRLFVLRHSESGAAEHAARVAPAGCAIINAGDGTHAHPTQALLDLYTMGRHFSRLADLRVTIVGDILHSRVARSLIHGLKRFDAAEIRLCGPATLLPEASEFPGAHPYTDLDEAIHEVDVIYVLRLQRERMHELLVPEKAQYRHCYGLTAERLQGAGTQCLVMHPGPLNRGVEIDSEVADGPQSAILEQVGNGVPIRMAVMARLLESMGAGA